MGFFCRKWLVTGGKDGLTCTNLYTGPNSNELWCGDDISVPECVDRTVYCLNPDVEIENGEMRVLENPSPNYMVGGPDVCSWSPWYNSDIGSNDFGDKEFISGLHQIHPKSTCPKPIQFQARSILGQTPAELTGETFIYYDTSKGFYCVNHQQNDSLCLDYEVRMCCPAAPQNGTIVEYACNTAYQGDGEWYLDYQDVKFARLQRLVCTNNGTWQTDLDTGDFCPFTGADNCREPKIKGCQDRTVTCMAPLPEVPDMEYFDVTQSGLRSRQVGSSFLYRCKDRGEYLFLGIAKSHAKNCCFIENKDRIYP